MGEERKRLHALIAGDPGRIESLFVNDGEFFRFVGHHFQDFGPLIGWKDSMAEKADAFIALVKARAGMGTLWQALEEDFGKSNRIGEIHEVRDLWNALGQFELGSAGPSRDWQLRYFERLEEELGNIRPAIPPRADPQKGVYPRQQWPLQQVFVPLELSSRGRVEADLDWSRLIKADREVLTGGAGSGKSTLLRHLALTAAQRRRARLTPGAGSPAGGADGQGDPLSRIPVWMSLPSVAQELRQGRGPGGTHWYKQLTRDAWLNPVASATYLGSGEEARALLETGELLLVFDGLDEIADPQARTALAELISKLPSAFGGLGVKNPVVVACREKAWGRGGPFAHFEQIHIQPMDQPKWERYFDRWCRAVWEADADRVLQRLEAALRGSGAVQAMAANPQTATMLAVLAHEGELPHQRVRLYDEYLRFALASERLEAFGGGDEVRAHLVALAVEAQSAAGPSGAPLDGLSESRARCVLGRRLVGAGTAEPPEEELRKKGEPLLNDLELHTGLVSVHRSDGPSAAGTVVSFAHRTMQEYLVACHYASRPQELLAHEKDASWLVTIALTSALLAKEEAFDRLEQLLAHLARRPPAAAVGHGELVEWGERLAVLSECLEELSSWNVPPATLAPARAAYESIGSLLEGLAPRARVAVAEGMGIVGDPRLAPAKASRWVEIPEGSSIVGSESEEAWVQERPVRKVHLSPFRVQRWPVTVSEYGRFVEARGYADGRWWDEPGARWRAEAHVVAPDGWERLRPFGNRPVTGVSWWEARAYARWLTTIEALPDGWAVTLPTEAQWERAARGPLDSPPHAAGRFPWGKDWDAKSPRASCGRLLQGACPVGLFPGGHSVEGVWDLAGNVGERCLDGFGKPPPADGEAPRDPCRLDDALGHSVRGGDWWSPPLSARVSARFPDSRSARDDRTGFRCVAWRAPEELR